MTGVLPASSGAFIDILMALASAGTELSLTIGANSLRPVVLRNPSFHTIARATSFTPYSTEQIITRASLSTFAIVGDGPVPFKRV
ncbi:hypothetical protein PENSPDRAFT_651919 [Peniophora sp. CONT]|nr:hypothetical protein PENSPDRAFT_651919 [Peniophora sp. CONT]